MAYNNYIVPICDMESGMVWNEVISCTNIAIAKEKIAKLICDKYDWANPYDYREFIEFADEQDVLIGEILDIETL